MCDPAGLRRSHHPVQAAYGVFSCFPYNENHWRSGSGFYGSDFSGNAGIQGQLTDSSGNTNYYPSKFGANAFFNRHVPLTLCLAISGQRQLQRVCQVNIPQTLHPMVLQLTSITPTPKSIDLHQMRRAHRRMGRPGQSDRQFLGSQRIKGCLGFRYHAPVNANG